MRLLPFLLAAAAALSAAQPQADAAALTAREMKAVEAAATAYRHGSPGLFVQQLSPLFARLNEEKLSALEEEFEKRDMPGVAKQLAGARLSLVQQGLARRLPRPRKLELVLTVSGLHEQVQQLLQSAKDHRVMSDPPPKPDSLEAYRKLIWETHVLSNRLESARKIALYAVAVAKGATKRDLKSATPEQQASLNANFATLKQQIDKLDQRLEEREFELRVGRLLSATGSLKDTKELRERIMAAWVVEFDGRVLGDLFKQSARSNKKFLSTRLNDPALPSKIAATVEAGRRESGDLAEKSRLLHVGLHWWLRGRYGHGPDGGGLLKGPLALRSAQAQFALYMPAQAPQPTDPLQRVPRQSPSFDRRHHFTWAWEDRKVVGYNYEEKGPSQEFRVTTRRFY